MLDDICWVLGGDFWRIVGGVLDCVYYSLGVCLVGL